MISGQGHAIVTHRDKDCLLRSRRGTSRYRRDYFLVTQAQSPCSSNLGQFNKEKTPLSHHSEYLPLRWRPALHQVLPRPSPPRPGRDRFLKEKIINSKICNYKTVCSIADLRRDINAQSAGRRAPRPGAQPLGSPLTILEK